MKWSIVAVVLACARIAVAQPDEPAPPPPPPEQPAPAPQPPPPAPRTDPGWQLYHQTFDELARGRRARARELAAQLMRLHPDHEATMLVRGAGLSIGPSEVDRPVDLVERPSKSARAELAALQTLHGIAVGVEVCIVLSCDDPTAVLGLILAGGAAGAGISLNVGDLTSGERALVNSGTIWGAGNAILLAIASDPAHAETVGGMLLAGQAGGIAIGVALFSQHPTAGQVALANSGGEWALVLTGLTMASFDSGTFSTRDTAMTLIVAMDAGIIVGGFLATRMPEISRGQTLVIDAGGIVGGVAGGGVGVLISGNFDDRTTPLAAAIGAAVGLGAAAYLTRDWHREGGNNASAYFAPVEHAHGGIAGMSMKW